MIEMLTMLNPGSPSWADNAPLYATSQLCVACGGRSTPKKLACTRCNGTGRIREAGRQKQSMSKKTASLTAADVAGLCRGMPRHKYWAALVYVNADHEARINLRNHLLENVISVAAHKWKLTDVDRKIRSDGMAENVTQELINVKRPKARVCAREMGIDSKTWYATWRRRHDTFAKRLYGWLDDADRHMLSQYFDDENVA